MNDQIPLKYRDKIDTSIATKSENPTNDQGADSLINNKEVANVGSIMDEKNDQFPDSA